MWPDYADMFPVLSDTPGNESSPTMFGVMSFVTLLLYASLHQWAAGEENDEIDQGADNEEAVHLEDLIVTNPEFTRARPRTMNPAEPTWPETCHSFVYAPSITVNLPVNPPPCKVVRPQTMKRVWSAPHLYRPPSPGVRFLDDSVEINRAPSPAMATTTDFLTALEAPEPNTHELHPHAIETTYPDSDTDSWECVPNEDTLSAH